MTGSGLRAAAGRILWVDALGALGAGTLVLLLDHQLAAWYRMPLTVVTMSQGFSGPKVDANQPSL